MCQIIVSSKFKLSQDLLRSLWQSNSDGIGFAGGGQPVKLLPKNFHELWTFYLQHIHLQAGAVHFRMRTDGDISLARVHPYEVVRGRLWLMHNGILSDFRSKQGDPQSDTEKYVAQVLRPLLRRSPTLWKQMEFQRLVESHIGSGNRFVFVDNHGETAILNRRTGYDVGNDWYANGYSFDSGQFFPAVFGYGSVIGGYTSGYRGYRGSSHYSSSTGIEWEDDDTLKPGKWTSAHNSAKSYPPAVPTKPAALTHYSTPSKVVPAPHAEEDPLPMVSDAESLAIALGCQPNTYLHQAMTEALRDLRTIDSQEYHGIRQEVLNIYKQVKDEEDLTRLLKDLVGTVCDTLDSYGLLAAFQDDPADAVSGGATEDGGDLPEPEVTEVVGNVTSLFSDQ